MKFKTSALDWLNYIMILLLVVAIAASVIYSNRKNNEEVQKPPQSYGNDTTAVVEEPILEEAEPEYELDMAAQVLSTMKDNRDARRMPLSDANGKVVSYCTVYKGRFDGHTWYVFYDNLAVPSVVHDPLCECGK